MAPQRSTHRTAPRKRPGQKKPSEVPRVPTTSASEEKKKRRWTVMIYLAGDNNLTEECAFAISEMKQVKELSRDMHLLVQFDPKGTHLPTQRFEIVPNPDGSNLVEKRANISPGPSSPASPYKLGETDTGSARTLYDFIAWGIQIYPAHSYLVALSGHGGGVEDSFLLRDENPSGSLGLKELKSAFQSIKKDFGVEIDIVGLDTCLMSMAEVAYQLKDSAKILVGSEGYAPLGGWPYRPILDMISQKAEESAISADNDKPDESVLTLERKNVARSIVCTYADYYMEFVSGGVDVEQAALDIAKSGLLAKAVGDLGSLLKERLLKEPPDLPFIEALILAHWDAQSYNGEIFVDLRDFCNCLVNRLGASTPADPVKTLCRHISGDIIGNITDPCNHSTRAEDSNGYYVLKTCYTGPTFQFSYGVSIYFPWSEVIPYYENLDFAQATKWHEFLEEYVRKTRRPPRLNGERLLGDNDSTLPARQSSGKQSSGKYERPVIRSMRNPPIALKGLSKCFDKDDRRIGTLKELIPVN